jgi:hypothetical protein
VANNFFYSFAEDSDGNGRIDRIRAQCLWSLWSTGKRLWNLSRKRRTPVWRSAK